jgi:type II secretory pathway pseudopilin PulG
MDLQATAKMRNASRRSGFTIVEAVVAMGVIGLLALAMYAGMASATFSVRLARENQRATDVMVDKMEAIRLFAWDQLTNVSYLPTNFTAYYVDSAKGSSSGVVDPAYVTSSATNTIGGQGIVYTGTIQLSKLSTADRNYSNDMRVLTLTVNWTSGKLPRTRTLSTYIGKYGIQNYVIQ